MSYENYYSRTANFYDTWLLISGYRGAVNNVIGHLPFNINDSFNVLDVGCGTGLYSIAILKKFPNSRITAFDINGKMIEKMSINLRKLKLEKRADIFVGDALRDIPNTHRKIFDLVVTGGVLEHVDIQPAVQNISKYLAEDGYFLNSPVRNNLLGNVFGKLFKFKPYEAKENMSTFLRNGFELDRVIKIPSAYYLIYLLKTVELFRKLR